MEGDVLAGGEAVVAGLAGDDLWGSDHHPRHGLDLDGVSDGSVLVVDDAGVRPVILQPVVLYGQLTILGDSHYAQPTLPTPLSEGQAVLRPGDVGSRTSAQDLVRSFSHKNSQRFTLTLC